MIINRDQERMAEIKRLDAEAEARHQRRVLARREEIDTKHRKDAERETDARDVPPGQTKGYQRVRRNRP